MMHHARLSYTSRTRPSDGRYLDSPELSPLGLTGPESTRRSYRLSSDMMPNSRAVFCTICDWLAGTTTDDRCQAAHKPPRTACTSVPTIRIRQRRGRRRRHLSGLAACLLASLLASDGTDAPVIMTNCSRRTPLSQRSEWCARYRRRLYFFSKRSCCWGDSSAKLGGHTLRVLYGLL